MRTRLFKRLLLLLMLSLGVLSFHVAAHAAPGQFLFQWGKPALFEGPRGVAFDNSGNLYVVDNSRVQVVDKNGKLLRRWGSYGSGDGQFLYPTGIAVAGDIVYVTDAGKGMVLMFDSGGNYIKGWEGMSQPQGIATDSKGTVYVTTLYNGLQIFDGNGTVLRSIDTFNYVSDLAVDSAGNIFAMDMSRIQVFDSEGRYLRSLGPYGSFDSRIAVDRGGNIYAVDYAGVRVYDSGGALLRTWGEAGYGPGQLAEVRDVAIDASGNLFLADQLNNQVKVFDSNGKLLKEMGAAPGEISDPKDVATDAFGNVYLLNNGLSRIDQFDSRGNFMKTMLRGAFEYNALATDSAGLLYLTSMYNITAIDNSGKVVKYGGVDTYGAGLGDLAVDAAGNVYVPNLGSHEIHVFDRDLQLIRSWGGQGSAMGQFSSPTGVALDSSGNVYVADSGNSRVQVFTGDGALLRTWENQGTGDGEFTAPTWIAIDGKDNVYVTDYDAANGKSRIQVFDSMGKFLGKWGSYGSGAGQFIHPAGLAINDSAGTVYVVDAGNARVQAYQGYGGQVGGGWTGRDIGSVGLKGSSNVTNGVFTLQGSGADIWGSADGFHFLYKPLAGDGEIVARVASVQNTNGYAKAGVMIRESFAANSAHAMVDITPGHGAEFSRRVSTGATTTATTAPGIAAPEWVKLVRKGSSFSAYISKDGIAWTSLGSAAISMASTAYVGLIASSHNNSVLCTATMDKVSLSGQSNTPSVTITAPAAGATFTAPASIPITAAATPAVGTSVAKVEIFAGATLVGTATTAAYSVTWNNVAAGSYSLIAKATDTSGGSATSSPVSITVAGGGVPAPWATKDIGSVGVAGSAAYANGVFTLKGSGADIWGSADAFRFVYKQLDGDGEIVARVASLQNTSSYAKSGVMIRQSLAANSMHAMMDLKPTGGAEFSRRTSTGGTTAATTRSGVAAPYWVRVTRSGSTFRGYVSSDGKTWSQVGSATINMTGPVYVGLVVNSHNNSTLCTTTIDGVK